MKQSLLLVCFILAVSSTASSAQYRDLSTCIQDVTKVGQDVQKLISDAQSGNMEAVMTDAMTLVQEVPTALKDCGITSPQKAMDLGLEHLDAMGYGSQCVTDLESLFTDVAEIAQMVSQGNIDFSKVVADLQAIVKLVPETMQDCGFSFRRMGPLSGNMTCEQAMDKIAADVPGLVKDVESENWAQLLTDAEAAYQDIMGAVSSCEGASAQDLFDDLVAAVLKEVTLPSGADAAKCEADIDAMFPDFQTLIKDVEAGDQSKILIDALKIYNDIESSMKDCLGKSEIRVQDMSSCINDLSDVAAKGRDIYSQVQSGSVDFGTVIADVQAIVADLQKAKSDCTLSFVDMESEPVLRELAAETVQCQSLETCFTGCSGMASPVDCGSLNHLQCQKLKQRAMRLAGQQKVECRRQCRRLASKCASVEQQPAPQATATAACAELNPEGECMDKEIESLQEEIGKSVDYQQLIDELFGEAQEFETDGEFEVEEVSDAEFQEAQQCRRTRKGMQCKRLLSVFQDDQTCRRTRKGLQCKRLLTDSHDGDILSKTSTEVLNEPSGFSENIQVTEADFQRKPVSTNKPEMEAEINQLTAKDFEPKEVEVTEEEYSKWKSRNCLSFISACRSTEEGQKCTRYCQNLDENQSSDQMPAIKDITSLPQYKESEKESIFTNNFRHPYVRYYYVCRYQRDYYGRVRRRCIEKYYRTYRSDYNYYPRSIFRGLRCSRQYRYDRWVSICYKKRHYLENDDSQLKNTEVQLSDKDYFQQLLESPEIKMTKVPENKLLEGTKSQERCYDESLDGKYTRECIVKGFEGSQDLDEMNEDDFFNEDALYTVSQKQEISEKEFNSNYGCFRSCYYTHHHRVCYRRCSGGYHGRYGYRYGHHGYGYRYGHRYGYRYGRHGYGYRYGRYGYRYGTRVCRYRRIYRFGTWRQYRVCYNRGYSLNAQQPIKTLEESNNYCELSINKDNWECLLQDNMAGRRCIQEVGNLMTQARNMQLSRRWSTFFASAAKAMGNIAEAKQSCGNFQTIWRVMIDGIAAQRQQRGFPVNMECKTMLYGVPNMSMRYLGTWMTDDLRMIQNATFTALHQMGSLRQACGMSRMNLRRYLQDYNGCVNNVVNLAYQRINMVKEGMMTQSLGLSTRGLTRQVRSYVKSLMSAKYMCSPRGMARSYRFVAQERCIRNMVSMAQNKHAVAYYLEQGDIYHALLSTSMVFGDMGKASQSCRLVPSSYRGRRLFGITCESATLNMQTNAMKMAMDFSKGNMERGFYNAAQAWRGGQLMFAGCKSMRQAFYAFTRGQVILMANKIRSAVGIKGYRRCMQYSQTPGGWTARAGWFKSYLAMDVQNMTNYMKMGYMWDNEGFMTCGLRQFMYPSPRRMASFGKCMYTTNAAIATDRHFGLTYMSMRPLQRAQRRSLGQDMYKLLMQQQAMTQYCNIDPNYHPVFSRNQTAMQRNKLCAKQSTLMFLYLRRTAMQCMAHNWMNVFMDMSRTAEFGEKSAVTCDIQPQMVRTRRGGRRLDFDESKMLKEVESFDFELEEEELSLASPQESAQTEERKLVAY